MPRVLSLPLCRTRTQWPINSGYLGEIGAGSIGIYSSRCFCWASCCCVTASVTSVSGVCEALDRAPDCAEVCLFCFHGELSDNSLLDASLLDLTYCGGVLTLVTALIRLLGY
jgi:hypothetical protein